MSPRSLTPRAHRVDHVILALKDINDTALELVEIAFPIRRKTRADPGRVEELSIAVNELNEWNVLRENLLELRCHFAAPLGIGGVKPDVPRIIVAISQAGAVWSLREPEALPDLVRPSPQRARRKQDHEEGSLNSLLVRAYETRRLLSLPKISSGLAPACRSANVLYGCLVLSHSSIRCARGCVGRASRETRKFSFCGNSCSS